MTLQMPTGDEDRPGKRPRKQLSEAAGIVPTRFQDPVLGGKATSIKKVLRLDHPHVEEVKMQTRERRSLTTARYTAETADYILSQLAQGRPLDQICKEPGMPTAGAVVQWAVYDVDGFGDRYRNACQIRAEVLIDQIISIADDSSEDYSLDEDGKPVFNSDKVMRDKLKIETRKWYVGKILPKKYGDAILLKQGDADGNSLAAPIINIIGLKPGGVPAIEPPIQEHVGED